MNRKQTAEGERDDLEAAFAVKNVVAVLNQLPKERQLQVVEQVMVQLGIDLVRGQVKDGVSLPPLMTRKELAGYLHCSVSTIDRRMSDGCLEFLKDGGKILFSQQHVKIYLTKLRRQQGLMGRPTLEARLAQSGLSRDGVPVPQEADE